MASAKYMIRQWIKLGVQNAFLPLIYNLNRRKPVKSNQILFADAHHTEIPYSMQHLHKVVEKSGNYEIIDLFCDYQAMSTLAVTKAMLHFMKLYAQAGYVVICDNFLPVASCHKRKETRVIQLWHAGGILKKYAYDTEDDIPAFYKSNVFANYDYISTSAACCIPVYERAMRQPEGVVHGSGLSRTDEFFDQKYIEDCRREFFEQYPEAEGRKLVLWAPTFRGKASQPTLIGEETVRSMQERLGKEWYLITKLHPHFEAKNGGSSCSIATERLLPVIDVLITDYSSVIFDYVLFEKPLVLFVPDMVEYKKLRGFYIELEEIPADLVVDPGQLYETVKDAEQNFDAAAMHEFRMTYMGACDGHATQRICEENRIRIVHRCNACE